MRFLVLSLFTLLFCGVPAFAATDTERLDAYVLDESVIGKLGAVAAQLRPHAGGAADEERGDEEAYDSSEDEGGYDAEEESEDGTTLDGMAERLRATPQAMAVLDQHDLEPLEYATVLMVLTRLFLADGFAGAAGKSFEAFAAETGVPAHQIQFFASHRAAMTALGKAMNPDS